MECSVYVRISQCEEGRVENSSAGDEIGKIRSCYRHMVGFWSIKSEDVEIAGFLTRKMDFELVQTSLRDAAVSVCW